jgi:glycosyltransferase involved in cell wall biosynthesis
VLAFEGPDRYSMVGGLGTRVTELSNALADAGVRTTLVFVGDPGAPAAERVSANLEYRRWCQSVSTKFPGGVYEGELGKMNDYTASVPQFVSESIVAPAAARAESVLIVAEEWQTAACTIELDAMLTQRGMRERAVLAWNANNTYGFDTIDWESLERSARITTVSRYMKFELQRRGVEASVIPNGIPERLIGGASPDLVRQAHQQLRRPLFVKVARFEEDKRWMQAVEAFARLRARHPEATLLTRGGREPYGNAVFERARELGVAVEHVAPDSGDPSAVIGAFARAAAPIVDVRSFIPEEALLALYHAADAVLANSGREPFGLVGLEVMAVGGVAVTGSTGEDYAQPFENAIVCDTGDAGELAGGLEAVLADDELARTLRAGAVATARRYTWSRVLETLLRKLEVSE